MRYTILFTLSILLTGCAVEQFKIGPEVAPPHGCAEARSRGHDC